MPRLSAALARAFFSQVSHDPDIAIEVFLLDAAPDHRGVESAGRGVESEVAPR